MKTICLYFEIHQIIHLKRYRFFDIGTDHYYYDDYENERSISDIAERSYMPALNTFLEMIRANGKYFKVAFSISGVGLEQLEMHAPQVITKLQELNDTGCVEFLAEPYSHGLSSLVNEEAFAADVKKQAAKMQEYFGKKPTVLRNSSLIYSDDIGGQAAAMGFKGMLTEGAKHVLGWKSPHYVYNCAIAPNLKLLLRDVDLSDDISLRFNNSDWEGYPLFADNYINRIASLPDNEQVINIFMELSALGIAQPLSSNILEFIKAMDNADCIMCVSELTRQTVINHYYQDPRKCFTVHNAVYPLRQELQDIPRPDHTNKEKIVTFLGRITMQKGPEYFVEAANMVLHRTRNVRFCMAGSGDMMDAMIYLAAERGIADRFHFPGFMRGKQVYECLKDSDVYVMPSVSEPFGISPLEAMQCGTPSIISKQSGCAEILTNCIKVDYWDIHALADAIYSICHNDSLFNYLQTEGKREVDQITWEKVGLWIRELYERTLGIRS